MTEPMANAGLENQIQNLHQSKDLEAKVECGDVQTLIKPKDAESSQVPLSADLISNPGFADTFAVAEPDMADSDKVNDMTSEMQTNGTPLEMGLEKQRDDQANAPDDKLHSKPFERQTDDQVTMPVTGISSAANTFVEQNLAEKSEEVGHTPMEKVEYNKTPLDEQRDNQSPFPHTCISPSGDEFLEHKLADKSEKADATYSLNHTDSTPLKKESDITSLRKQSDQVTVPMAVNSKSVEASAEHNSDGILLKNQSNGTLSVKETDDTPLQTDSQATAPSHHMDTEMKEAVAIPLENVSGPAETNMMANPPEDVPTKTPLKEDNAEGEYSTPIQGSNRSFIFEPYLDGNDSGSEDEQASFMKELEHFHQERSLDFKAPKFYGEPLNCLKLWRTVTRLGGYDQVTACKLWRQVGESFNPPKTCTTISWSFRMFYEKALLEYEKHKYQTGELKSSVINLPAVVNDDNQSGGNQASSSGRARRDAAARAMQVWHTQRLLDTGEVGDSNIKDKNLLTSVGKDKQLMATGKLKRKPSHPEPPRKVAKVESVKAQGDIVVSDVGTPADWVKINVLRTNEFFEVYALVPGLLREEVQVQSDPVGRLIISGEPEYPDNPWGVTPFKKVITLPARIDPYQTSAVVTLHGQLFVRAPIDPSDV